MSTATATEDAEVVEEIDPELKENIETAQADEVTEPEVLPAIVESPTGVAEWSPIKMTEERIDVIASTIAVDATPAELELFVEVIESSGLNPFQKQIHFSKIKGKVSFITGIDGFRLIAQRTGLYDGQSDPEWCDENGNWHDVWLWPDKKPMAARVRAFRKDWAQPVTGVVTWAEFGVDNRTWRQMPTHMLAKCAESHALRKAFPAELSGLYTADEMSKTLEAEQPRRRRSSNRNESRGGSRSLVSTARKNRIAAAYGKLTLEEFRSKVDTWLAEPNGYKIGELDSIPKDVLDKLEPLLEKAFTAQEAHKLENEPFEVDDRPEPAEGEQGAQEWREETGPWAEASADNAASNAEEEAYDAAIEAAGPWGEYG